MTTNYCLTKRGSSENFESYKYTYEENDVMKHFKISPKNIFSISKLTTMNYMRCEKIIKLMIKRGFLEGVIEDI